MHADGSGSPAWAELTARTASELGLAADLLDGFLPDLAAAARGRRPEAARVDGYRAHGREAARRGVALSRMVDLYLTAARVAWSDLPADRDGGADVLAAIDDLVAAVCEGYEQARRSAARAEEALRREFVDDLLTGSARHAQVIERASAYGLRLEAAHVVLVVAGSRPFLDHRVMVRDVEAALRARLGRAGDPSSLLVATRSGLLVAVVPAEQPDSAVTAGIVGTVLDREPALGWRLAVSRGRTGASGVRLGFEEARSSVELAERLQRPDRIVRAEDLLIYEVLTRDRERAVELVDAVLAPLQRARGGAEPLLQTLRVYFSCGGVAVTAAKQLHLSVRAVTYRLSRVAALTGRDPADPEDRFVLDAALRTAAVLDWPASPLRPRDER